jgi:hypothetical protein
VKTYYFESLGNLIKTAKNEFDRYSFKIMELECRIIVRSKIGINTELESEKSSKNVGIER